MGAPLSLLARDGFVELRFTRPEALNTLTLASIERFAEALAEVESRRPRCLLLTAEGRSFMAGGDLTYLAEAGDAAPAQAARVIDALNGAMLRLMRLPCPTVVAVQGAVAGAGLSLTLACDLAIGADDVRFVFAYDKIAATPDGGLTWMLPRVLGLRRALATALLAQPIEAEQALALGLLSEVVARDALDEAAQCAARKLARGPTLAYAATRQLMLEGFERPFEAQLEAERQSFCAQAGTADFRGAVEAFFARREPEHHGR